MTGQVHQVCHRARQAKGMDEDGEVPLVGSVVSSMRLGKQASERTASEWMGTKPGDVLRLEEGGGRANGGDRRRGDGAHMVVHVHGECVSGAGGAC